MEEGDVFEGVGEVVREEGEEVVGWFGVGVEGEGDFAVDDEDGHYPEKDGEEAVDVVAEVGVVNG